MNYLHFLLPLLYVATPEVAYAEEPAPPAEETATPHLEDKIRAAFPEEPERMVAIARCESHLEGHAEASQFEADGVTPRYGRHSTDTGAFQINQIHFPDAAARGIDLRTEDGNVAFARHLYDTQGGTHPWYMSEGCWRP